MSVNPFLVQFKSYTNTELFGILFSNDQYQPQAVEAARQELSLRNLSAGEWLEMEKQWMASQEEFVEKKSKSVDKVMANKIGKLGQHLNPFIRTGADKDIAMIILSVSFFMVFSLIVGYGTIVQTLRDFSFRYDDILVLFPFIMVPPALYFFYGRDKLGWIILSAWAVYNFILVFSIVSRLFRNQEFYFLFQPADPTSIFIGLAIFGSLLAALNRPPVLQDLAISKRMQWSTILIAIIISAFLILP